MSSAQVDAVLQALNAVTSDHWIAKSHVQTLADEVTRLRAENARVRNEWEDQNAELAKLDAWRHQVVGEVEALKAENAELKSDCDVLRKAQKITYAARAELDWFRRREQDPSLGLGDYRELYEWEIHNPKPGAGT